MKKNVILYGQNNEFVSKIEKIVESLPDVIVYVAITDGKETDFLQHYENIHVHYVVFVGICPASELHKAVHLGAEIFIVGVPAKIIDRTIKAYVSEINSINDPKLVRQLKSFMGNKPKELSSVKIVS